MKIRESGYNCLALSPTVRTNSKGYMLNGTAEEADLAVEHPWTGVFGTVEYEHNMGTFSTDSLAKSTSTGSTHMLSVGFNADLGYVLNNKALSEVWVDMRMGFGTASYDLLPNYGYFTPKGDDGFAMKFVFGAEKRYYMIPKMYIAGGVDLEYELQAYSYSNDGSLGLGTVAVIPAIKIAYMQNPNLDFYTSVGYNLPLSTSASFSDKDGNDINIADDYSKDSALNIKLGVNVHVDFAGPFANMFKKPSTKCNNLKIK